MYEHLRGTHWTRPRCTHLCTYAVLRERTLYQPLDVSIQRPDRWDAQVPRCEAWLNRACVESHDAMECKAAHTFCSEQFMGPYFNALWNPYDVSKACPSLHEDLCYPVTTRIANLLDQPAIRKQLGVPDDSPPFQGCNMQVNGRFHARDDDVPTIDTFVSRGPAISEESFDICSGAR